MPAWKKVESPMVATSGSRRPARWKPWARPRLEPMASSVQQELMGAFMPRIVQPMSPVTTTSSLGSLSALRARFSAR